MKIRIKKIPQNAAKWKHEDGGLIPYQDGGSINPDLMQEWNNYLTWLGPDKGTAALDSYSTPA